MPTSSGRGSGHSPANVTKNLKGIDFPTDKEHLLKHAQQLHAEKVVIDEIQRLDERQYNSMADVMKAFGHISHGEGQQAKPAQPVHGKSQSKSAHHR